MANPKKPGVTGHADQVIDPFTQDARGVTASASANVAIVALSTLPPTHGRDALIKAQTYMGDLDVRALERLEAALADQSATTPPEFDKTLVPATVRRFVKTELEARRGSKKAEGENWKHWGGIVLTAVLTAILTLLLAHWSKLIQ
jgi:hypothetical protein